MGAVVEFRNPATARVAAPAASALVPRQRRVARVLPARSARALVFHALRDAMAPDWSPMEAARSLVDDADGAALTLRAARRRLRLATEGRITPCQARAQAAITIAIEDLELSAEPVAGGSSAVARPRTPSAASRVERR